MKMAWRWGAILCFSIEGAGGEAWAQEPSGELPDRNPARVLATTASECLPGARSIHELTPQLALNDFDGRGQTVAAISYSYSQCIGDSPNRWFVQASAAHVDERGFSADAALLGVGLEWRPSGSAPHLVVAPVLRIGREDFRPGGGNTIYNAAVTFSDVIPLRLQERNIAGRDVSISSLQFEWAARAEYTNRTPTGSTLLDGSDGTTFFGSVALDYALGRSNWRSKASLAYQTLHGGPVDGFVNLGLSFRRVNPGYTNYGWNFAVSGQLGDSGFRGLILSVSRRFGR